MTSRITNASIDRTDDIDTLKEYWDRLSMMIFEVSNAARDREKLWYRASFLSLRNRWESVNGKLSKLDREGETLGSNQKYYEMKFSDMLC